MERLTRAQVVNRQSALGELASDNSFGLESQLGALTSSGWEAHS